MEPSVTPTLDLVEYGRYIGMFPRLGRAAPDSDHLRFAPAPDANVWLRGGDVFPEPWTKTPLATSPGLIFSFGDAWKATTPTTNIPTFQTLQILLPAQEVMSQRSLRTSTEFNIDPAALAMQAWKIRAGGQNRDFLSVVSRIRSSADLTVGELTQVLGRSRKQYYNWLKKGTAPQEIESRARVIADALHAADSQPPHRIKGWLLGASTRELLAEPDLEDLVEQARSWAAAAVSPRLARRVSPGELTSMAAIEQPPLDEDELARFFERPALGSRVAIPRNPNFYRDLSSVPDDDE